MDDAFSHFHQNLYMDSAFAKPCTYRHLMAKTMNFIHIVQR
ncbi:hypothetical protein HMPREF6745_1829 [Prevotella sp. oral taxon 472 str. F0295]|nr:hypothetical protein HMPREF6745_1829 [Prevotella sp. oral taxon 472 str. F0295]